jgi:branched-subunit amino acid aminotransferase/4-amino-4-deoxychorismate lyase
LLELASRNGLADQDSRARLLVSRGASLANPLPLTDLVEIEPTFAIILQTLPAELATWQTQGIKVQVMKSAFARGNFPQLKTTNYLPSLIALRFAAENSCQEAFLVDKHGKILEGATSNVFIVTGERLITPPARLGLLAGRTRNLVLASAEELGFAWEEEAIHRRDLATAEEVFVTSSIKEVTPVIQIDEARVADGLPGPITKALQKNYRQSVQDALAKQAS